MTFRTLLVIKAIVCLVFAVPFLLAPGVLLRLLGATVCPGGLFTAREYGAALVGTLLLTWFARRVTASDARGAILVDLLVYDAIGVVISLAGVLSGVLNVLGWGVVVVYLFFTVGSAYVLVREKPFRAAAAQARA
ncbi:MAG TPA: hypothetical protein VMT45_13360 [Thermoanaerobaculaceae bacterium]|nr:hypothetical protein [Thermoanaerobaculaceae bacterium]